MQFLLLGPADTAHQLSYPQHISFSSSSEQLIVKEYNSELPVVLPLPAEILCALEDDDDPCTEGGGTQRETRLSFGILILVSGALHPPAAA